MTLPQLKNRLSFACFLLISATCVSLSFAQANTKAVPTTGQAISYVLSRQVTGPANPCELILHSSDATNRPDIIHAVRERVDANRNRFLGQNPEQELSPIFNTLFLQYSKDLIAVSREQLSTLLIKLTDLWAVSQRDEIESNYTAAVTDQDQRPELVYRENLPYMPELFPSLALVLDSSELMELLPGSSESNSKPRSNVNKKNKQSIYEVIKNIRTGSEWISGGRAKDLEIWLRSELIKIEAGKFREALKILGTTVGRAIEGRIVGVASDGTGRIENWDRVLNINAPTLTGDWFSGAPLILETLYKYLDAKYPISTSNSKYNELQQIRQSITALRNASTQEMLADVININENKITLKPLTSEVSFNSELATGQLNHTRGLFPNLPGLDLELIHGAGSTKSTVASWRTLIGLFTSYGYNASGQDSPDSGMGPRLSGDFLLTARYMSETFRSKSSIRREQGHDRLPYSALGRSMGAVAVVADQLLNPNSPVDMAFAMSFSNPITMAAQTKNIYSQLERGIVSGIIPGALRDADTYSHEFHNLLKAAKLASPEAFATAGNLIVNLQGDDDDDARVVEEGQPDVLTALYNFRDEFTPAAHVYEFHSPLKDHPALVNEDPEHLEATHFLISNRDNLKRSDVEGSAAWDTIPDENLPQVKSQTLEVFAVMYGAYDYMINGLPSRAPWPTEHERSAQQAMERLRAQLAGNHDDGSAKTLFEWFLERVNKNNTKEGIPEITMEAVRAGAARMQRGEPLDRSLTSRMARAWHFWNVSEPARIEALYRKHGLIP